MRRTLLTAAAVLALSAATSLAAEWKIPLTVKDYDGANRPLSDVSNGVPLLPGQASETSELRLLDDKGNVVPAQFRVLARWLRKDNSIRWVLVDFQAATGEFSRKTYYLTNGGDPKVDSPLKVTQTDDAITVDTGPARFVIGRKRFNLIQSAWLDANGDGQFTDDELIVSPSDNNGSVVEDTYGLKYNSTEGTEEVKVEESGPVRVCVLARGLHKAAGGKGYSRGMDRFEVRMHFFANSAMVKFDPVIENNEAASNGAPTFEDYSLLTKVNIGPAVNSNPDYADHGPVSLYRVYGVAPIDGELKVGDSMTVYQDSNGSETWKINPGIEQHGKEQVKLSTFRGYRITKHTGAGEQELSSGDHAWGVVNLSGEKFGVVIVPRYFREKFPKAVTVSQDGSVRIGILPREYSQVHWIAEGGGAGMETWLYFYARDYKGKGITYARDTGGRSPWWNLYRNRPWPHVVADSVDPPLHALCTPEHYAACGALADVGPYRPIHSEDDFPEKLTLRRYFMTDYLKGNAYGWQSWGCRWEEFAGHSPWNYEAIATNDFAWRFINAQTRGWRDLAYPRLRHFSEVRCYRVGDNPRWNHPSFDALLQQSIDEEWGRFKHLSDDEVTKYSQGRYSRAEWPLPNPEHMSLDGALYCYLFYGDQRAYEGLKYPAALGGGFCAYKPANPSRSWGWGFRCFLLYVDLTGDKDTQMYMDKALDNFWNMARAQRKLAGAWPYNNNWMYGITSRAIVLSYDVSGDERMRDLAIGMAKHYPKVDPKSMYTARNDPLVTAFSWDQTGRKEFYDAERAKQYDGDFGDNQWVYFAGCASYLWLKDRPDTAPPAAVKDLAAASGAGGEVTLTWTAPGGDGDKGAASVYQVKYDDATLAEDSDGESVSFWAAQNCTGEPAPAKVGSKETFTVKGLKAGTHYFALKSRDATNNESEISNVAKVEVK
ncbi:MAG: hypothetical protein BIFFINMI_02436 [Phycisphaerae bacterium]|nr:hypothetical protein [Phycisphaerae bacterium]